MLDNKPKPVAPDLTTGKTQTPRDNSDKLATTKYVDNITMSQYVAGETLGGQRVVMLRGGKAYYYNPLDDNNIGRQLGMTNQAATKDSLVYVATDGIITMMGWNLTPNNIYYIGVHGTITKSLPTPPFVFQRVGIAIDANNLKLEFSEPVSMV